MPLLCRGWAAIVLVRLGDNWSSFPAGTGEPRQRSFLLPQHRFHSNLVVSEQMAAPQRPRWRLPLLLTEKRLKTNLIQIFSGWRI